MTIFQAPVNGKLGYGYIPGVHYAQDYEVPVGTPVGAAGPGQVVFVGDDGALGNTIKIQHPGGYETYYGNITQYLATVGETVTAGQEIGTSGGALNEPDPGDSTGPHLPYQVWLNGKAINPVTVTAPPNGDTANTASFVSSLDPLTAVTAPLTTIFGAFTNPGFWLRGAYIAIGSVLLLVIIIAMFSRTNTASTLVSTGKSAGKDALTAAVLAPK